MTPTPPPGPESATLLGPGFHPRGRPHAAEIGTVWGDFGVRSAVAPLTDVVLGWPGEELRAIDDPDAWLMLARPDLERMQAQCDAIRAAYEAEGVRVHVQRPAVAPPNHVFRCDLFFMTPEGAVLARMAARQRAGEERVVAEHLAGLGVPILLTPRGSATFEGADAMWLDARTVLIGVGRRTNAAAVDQIAPLLEAMGASVRVAEVSAGVQHLLGSLVPVDEGVACALRAHLTPSLRSALGGVRLIELDEDTETRDGRAMNFVTLRPRRVLMPAGCPGVRARLEAEGIGTVEIGVGEYLKAAGGVGCLTGVLRRG